MKDLTKFSYDQTKRADQNNPNERCAFCYANINGHTDDKIQENILVCRVWLLKEHDSNGDHAYLVDWHTDGYCENTTVLQLIDRAKIDLAKQRKQMIDELFQNVYLRYKLQWMIDHRYTLEDLMVGIQQKINAGASDIQTAFLDFQAYYYFGNELVTTMWSTMDEFRKNEWKDDAYMKRLLTSQEYGIWLFK